MFYKTLLESELGDNYSSGYGYDSSTQETTFSIGVDGTTADKLQLDLISKTISDTLAKLAQNGVDEKIFQSMLHQITFETVMRRVIRLMYVIRKKHGIILDFISFQALFILFYMELILVFSLKYFYFSTKINQY